MKNLLFIIVAFGCLSKVNIQAQTIVNSNFENWTPSGNPAPFDWEEPTNWKSTNSQTEWISAGVRNTSDSYAGLLACQLNSVFISGGWPSAMCNGNPNLIGNSFTDPSIDIITGGTPISSKPNKIRGYYKFDNSNSLDSGYAIVILKKYNTTLNKVDTIGIGDFYFPEALAYTQFEITIYDLVPLVTPDSIILAFYSTNPKNPQPPNFPSTGLVIDNLSLIYSTTSIENENNLNIEPLIYPNPANDIFVVQFEDVKTYEVHLYNLFGQQVKSVVGTGKTILNVTDFPSGLYYLKIAEQNNNSVFITSLIIK